MISCRVTDKSVLYLSQGSAFADVRLNEEALVADFIERGLAQNNSN